MDGKLKILKYPYDLAILTVVVQCIYQTRYTERLKIINGSIIQSRTDILFHEVL